MASRTQTIRCSLLEFGRRFSRASCGAAVMEYAVLLGVLVGGGIVAYVVAGDRASHLFDRAARVMASPNGGQSTGASSYGTQAGSSGVINAESHNVGGWNASIVSAAVLAMVLMAWATTTALGFWLWRVARRRIREKVSMASDSQSPVTPLSPGAYKRLVEKRQQIRRLLSRDLDTSCGFDTQVRHLMSKLLTTVRPEMAVSQAAAIMQEQRIRHLLVCQNGRELIGIISDRDLNERTGDTAQTIMTPEPAFASPEMAIGPAITLMLNRSISCLPVVEQGRLCGVLTTTDVMLSFQCILQVVAEKCASRHQADNANLPASGLADAEEEQEDLSMLIEV